VLLFLKGGWRLIKKSGMRKYIIMIMAIIFMVFSVIGCGSNESKVVSNLNPGTETTSTGESFETGATVDRPAADEGDSDQSPQTDKEAPEQGDPGEEKNGAADNEMLKDGVVYKGYSGPVQGEIKYKEGTPAGENSQEYKAVGDIDSPYHMNLIVTRDFGHTKMFGRTVGLVRDEVGMEVLFRNLDIQTAYGGGFVNAINGLESGYTFFTGADRKKDDWFYWVNGILAPVGVAEYRPQPGDVIWWDYHDWSMTMFIPAVIGSYPQPFKNGFWGKNPGTVVMYSGGYEDEALALKRSLEEAGVKQVDTAVFDTAALDAPKKYYILIGPWQELAGGSELIKEVNTKNKLVGVYVKFEDGELKGLDFKGKTVSSHQQAGAVFAYGSSIGSLNPVWAVTGTDDEGVKMALNTILNNPAVIKGYFGAVITKDGVTNVPYTN
jgi:hypothetical protein